MSAIITEQFRRQNAQTLLSDISNNSNSYYIGIGQQDSWQEVEGTNQLSPHPSGAIADQQRVLEHITDLFRVSNKTGIVVPRYTIDSSKQYKVYNPHDATCFYPSSGVEACFVCSNPSANSIGTHIFLCISKTMGTTTAALSEQYLGDLDHNSEGIYHFDDGYTWVYLGRILENTELNTNQFMAVSNSTTEVDNNIGSITSGLFYGLHLLNGGNVYATTNNSSAEAIAKLSGYQYVNGIETYVEKEFDITVKVNNLGAITDISFPDLIFQNANPPISPPDGATTEEIAQYNADLESYDSFIADYLNWDRAKIDILPFTGGLTLVSPAPLNPRTASVIGKFATSDGFGVNKLSTLPAWYIGFYCNTNTADYTPDGAEYRQISLIRNPKNRFDDSVLSSDYVKPLKYFTRTQENQTIPVNVGSGWRLFQGDKNIGILSHVQTVTGNNDISGTPLTQYRYYYYQDHRFGYGPQMTNSSPLTFKAPIGQTFIDQEINDIDDVSESGSYKQKSGEVLFIDNRGTIQRSEGQNEELKVIIQL